MKKNFAEERRDKIVTYVNERERADIAELAERFGATEATIRRDLVRLEQQHLVHRVHGGVLRRPKPSIWQSTTLQERLAVNLERKNRIAQFAAQLVNDGDSLMIDGGSTTMLIARQLGGRRNLLVVSNAPAIGETVISTNNNKVVLTGGELMKGTSMMTGAAAEASLNLYRTDKAIIGMSGILVDEGCFSASPQEAAVKRIMTRNARETIVAADSSKIGTRAFCFVCGFEQVNKIVTDSDIDEPSLKSLASLGVEIYTV